jgi:hypothetical protein
MARFINVLARVILFDNVGKILSEFPCPVLLICSKITKLTGNVHF